MEGRGGGKLWVLGLGLDLIAGGIIGEATKRRTVIVRKTSYVKQNRGENLVCGRFNRTRKKMPGCAWWDGPGSGWSAERVVHPIHGRVGSTRGFNHRQPNEASGSYGGVGSYFW